MQIISFVTQTICRVVTFLYIIRYVTFPVVEFRRKLQKGKRHCSLIEFFAV